MTPMPLYLRLIRRVTSQLVRLWLVRRPMRVVGMSLLRRRSKITGFAITSVARLAGTILLLLLIVVFLSGVSVVL